MTIIVGAELVPVIPSEFALDEAADPAARVVLALERAKPWLDAAVQDGKIDEIAELRSQADAIAVYTRQKQLGKSAELAATEIVRRAERGLGLAIRRGQAEGTVRGQGWNGRSGDSPVLPSPTDFTPQHDLSGSGSTAGIYDLTDDVTDDQFENAIDAARDERNLSRANVKRKLDKPVKSKSDRPEMLRRTRHHDPNRVVQSTVDEASHLRAGYPDLYDFPALDMERIPGWVSSLEESIRFLTTLKRRLTKELTRD